MDTALLQAVGDVLAPYGMLRQLSAAEYAELLAIPDNSFDLAVLLLAPDERSVTSEPVRVTDGNDFVDLVAQFAAATLGEWQPEHVTAAFTRESDFDYAEMVIDFDWHDVHFRWQFDQSSKYVLPGFHDAIAAFAAAHLSGDFVNVGDDHYVYLPRPAADAIIQLAEAWPETT